MVKIQDISDEPHIRVQTSDGIATVTLNRPAKKNAITRDMWHELIAIFEGFKDQHDIRSVIIRGAGGDFCAGADIGEFAAARHDAGSAASYEADNDRAFAAVRNCPIPVISAIRGICFGGGFGIAAATDIRLATPDSKFAVPAARLGLAYPARAMADIVNAVGVQSAKYLTFTGRSIDAETALKIGFVNTIVEDDEMDRQAGALARVIAENAPLSVKASKASIKAAVSGTDGDYAAAEAAGSITFESKDYAEGRAAFAERRKPEFKGH